MKIDELPIEMLMKIFSYLTRFDEVLLVNKLFYSVACKISDPNICLRLDDQLFKRNWLPSVEKTTRKMSKLDIYFSLPDAATCQTMISIVAKFGPCVKCLKIAQTRLTISEFLEILSLVPNVEHMIVERLDLREKVVSKRKRKISKENDLNLNRLKKLRFCGNNIVERDEFLAVFDRLPMGVLNELELSCFKLKATVGLFKRQTNIRKLEVEFTAKASDPVGIFDHLLQLESLVLSSFSSPDTKTFLSKHTQLRSLRLPYANTTEDILKFVADHITGLERLSVKIDTVPSVSCLTYIGKMKNLKDLTVEIDEHTATSQLESLAKCSYLEITSLSVHHKCLNVNLVQPLAKSLTKLKTLKLYCYDDCGAVINAVMKSFNFVEVLHICGDLHITGDVYQLNDGDCFNPKLIELMVPLPKNASWMYLNKLIADYPNLKKFRINWDPITSSEFRRILNGFTKLESLAFLGSAEWLDMDDLNYLLDDKKHLKFVSLGGLRIRLTDKLKRRISTAFGLVYSNEYTTRVMAIDRNTMKREQRGKGILHDAFS